MAVLREQNTGRRELLPARAVIGRSTACDLVIPRRSVSGHHAAIAWNGSEWELVDLGSRNGTALDGRRLAAGERGRLSAGAELRFGREAAPWILEDDAPPLLMARDLASGEWRIGEGGYLVLPDADDPEIGVFLDDVGEWRLDERGEVSDVTDRAVLTTADGGAWRLYLPTTGDRTVKESAGLLTVAGLRLSFAVSRDEEHVELTAVLRGRPVDLKARAHHYPLLVLARQRLADRAAGVPEAEAGWIHHEELARMLRLDDQHLNICIHRARNQLGKLGVADAAALVERRTGSRQLRIGVAELEVIAIGEEPPARSEDVSEPTPQG